MGAIGKPMTTQQTRHHMFGSFRTYGVRIAYVITFVLAALAIHQVVNVVIQWGQVRLDDLTYGRPRTSQLTGIVGHEDYVTHPTHFIAINLHRQIVVLELPGGDARKVRSLPGPYLFGDNEELTPVKLMLRDVNQDGLNDLLINVRNEQIIYLNKDGFFHLLTTEEQAALAREQK